MPHEVLFHPFLDRSEGARDLQAALCAVGKVRGRIVGAVDQPEKTLVRAEVPEIEIGRYAVDLRAATHGAGVFTADTLPEEKVQELRAVEVKLE